MAGAFPKDSILQQAGVSGAVEGGQPVDEELRQIATVLGPWLTHVGGGDRELTDEATGQYVAMTRDENVRVNAAVNGTRLAELAHGVPYSPEIRRAAAGLLDWARGLASESSEATFRVRQLLEDFADTAAELGMPMVREKHDNDEGFALYVPWKTSELPDDYRPHVDLYLMGVPTVAVSHSYEANKGDLGFFILATSSSAVTVQHVKARLGEELVRLAAALHCDD